MKEEIKSDTVIIQRIPYHLLEPNEKIVRAEDVLKEIFKNSVHIVTKNVSKGATSGNVYVPKKFLGHVATVIIWKDKNEYRGEEDGNRETGKAD